MRKKDKKKGDWREARITQQQFTAITNLSLGWRLDAKPVTNRGEACDEIKRLIAEVSRIKSKQDARETKQDRERVGSPIPVYRATLEVLPQWGQWQK